METEGKKFYITKEKLQELKKQHKELVAFERQKTVGVEAPKILESEDMNPEFISYHEDMDSLRDKIGELQAILSNYELIKNPPKEKRNIVGVGAKVAVHVDGKHDEFTIVSTLEANPELGKISDESPVGKALLGHTIGDEVIIAAPEKTKYKIKSIHYNIG